MANWTATNVTVLKSVIPATDKSENVVLKISMACDILKDGKYDHKYSIENIGIAGDGDFDGLATRTILAHLKAFSFSDSLSDTTATPIADVSITTDKPIIESDPLTDSLNSFQLVFGTLKQYQMLVDLGVITSDEPMYTEMLENAKSAFQSVAKLSASTGIAVKPLTSANPVTAAIITQ